MPQTYVLYHDHCPDGFGAAWTFHGALGCQECGEPVTYIPQTYGDPLPEMDPGSHLFILDFSYPRDTTLELQRNHERVTLLDHHKTAAEELDGLPNCHIDQTHSGAYLAWQYWNPAEKPPELILYLQDRDLWEWKLPHSREISEAIASYPKTFAVWDEFDTNELAKEGTALLRHMKIQVEKLVEIATMRSIAGVPQIPVVNTPINISETGEALLTKYPKSPFAALYFESKEQIRWSLRSRNTEDVDVSKIAGKFGGGGHKNAAGFVQNINNEQNDQNARQAHNAGKSD